MILTERCNLQCSYCYGKSMEEFDNGLDKRWTYDMAAPCVSEVTPDQIQGLLSQDDDPTLVFYGGEPLMQLEKIMQIMDQVPARYMLQTNGVLLHKLPSEYLNRMPKILVSLDGNEERTDTNRGKGRYHQIVKNLRLIRGNGYKGEIVARMTLSYPDIYEQVMHVWELVQEGLFDSVHWQLDAAFYQHDYDKEEFARFVQEYNASITKLVSWWAEKLGEGQVPLLYSFVGIMESLLTGEPTKLRCGSGYANYTITTSGKLSACPIMNSVENFYCGDMNSDLSSIREVHIGKPCSTCSYKGLCGGRCLYAHDAKLWPEEGMQQLCSTITHLIDSLQSLKPSIDALIGEGTLSLEDFSYEKYFGPEIIP